MRELSVIGAPSSAGAYAPGQEKAPDAFRRYGLISKLTDAGLRVCDRGDVPGFRWRPDLARPKAMNLDAVQRTASALAERVASAMAAGDSLLVLGGDCTVELGTVAGALRDGQSAGLVYIDLDLDLNTPDASDGALDWTGVAHLLDVPGVAIELSRSGPRQPLLTRSDILFFAANNISPAESETMRALALERISLAEVKQDVVAAAERAAHWAFSHDRLLVHLDVDVLSYPSFPIAENVRRCDALNLAELSLALGPLLAAPNFRALTVTEVNPDHAPDEASTFAELIAMLVKNLAPLA
jgi:arginase